MGKRERGRRQARDFHGSVVGGHNTGEGAPLAFAQDQSDSLPGRLQFDLQAFCDLWRYRMGTFGSDQQVYSQGVRGRGERGNPIAVWRREKKDSRAVIGTGSQPQPPPVPQPPPAPVAAPHAPQVPDPPVAAKTLLKTKLAPIGRFT